MGQTAQEIINAAREAERQAQAERDRKNKEVADRMKADRDAAEKAKADAHNKRASDRAAAHEAQLKAQARAVWGSRGFDPAQFETAWPHILDDLQRSAVVSDMQLLGSPLKPGTEY